MARQKSVLTDSLAQFLFLTDLPTKQCRKMAGCRTSRLLDTWHRLFGSDAVDERHRRLLSKGKKGELNPSYGRTGPDGFHWEGGNPVPDGKGYMLVRKPDWFTGRAGSKYVFEHHVVYCGHNGMTEIPSGYHVHHINGDKMDNRPTNLEMMTASDHSRLHQALIALAA